MLSMRSFIILLVLLVNTIYCEKENDGKGVLESKPATNGPVVNDVGKGESKPATNGRVVVNVGKEVLESKSDSDGPVVVNDVTEPIQDATTIKDTPTEPSGNDSTTTVDPTTTVTPTTTVPPTTTKPTTATTPTKPTVTPPTKPTVPTVTTAKPNTTSEMPVTTPYPPKNRHFDGASFIGGIILAVGLMGIGVIAFKYYKARTERNYHTL